MTERMTQDKIDRHTRERLAVVLSLLKLLSTQEDAQGGGFNDDGLSTIRAVRIAAWDGAAYLGEEILGESEGHHDTSLLWDVQRFLAITACALNGMEVNGEPWIDSPHSVRYLLALAQGLQERAEGEGPSTTVDAEEEGVVVTVSPRLVERARRIMKAMPGSDDLERLYEDIVVLAGDIEEGADRLEEAAHV